MTARRRQSVDRNRLGRSAGSRLTLQVTGHVAIVVLVPSIVTVGLIALRQVPYEGAGWALDSAEFSAVGVWFTGLVAAAAIASSAVMFFHQRRSEAFAKLESEAMKVRLVLSAPPRNRWAIRNDARGPITLIEINGEPLEGRAEVLLPGQEFAVEHASPLVEFGYRGDLPVCTFIFDDGEYRWTCGPGEPTAKRGPRP